MTMTVGARILSAKKVHEQVTDLIAIELGALKSYSYLAHAIDS
jgi:hypothetical protein